MIAALPELLPRSWTRRSDRTTWLYPALGFLSQQQSDREAVRDRQKQKPLSSANFRSQAKQKWKVRQDYESRLPALAAINDDPNNSFDIQSIADIASYAGGRPLPLSAMTLHQMDFKQFQAQKAEAEKHQTETKIRERNDYRVAQTKLLLEKVPERATRRSSPRLRRAVEFLKDYGFAGLVPDLPTWRARSATTQTFQRLVLDAMAFRDGQKAKAQV